MHVKQYWAGRRLPVYISPLVSATMSCWKAKDYAEDPDHGGPIVKIKRIEGTYTPTSDYMLPWEGDDTEVVFKVKIPGSLVVGFVTDCSQEPPM
jgi:hypothetical protein